MAYNNGWSSGLQTTAEGCYNTGVNLPNGAKITAVTIFYKGSGAGSSLAKFYRKKFGTGVADLIATGPLPDVSGNRKSASLPVTLASATINNNQYSLGLGICLGDNTDVFYSAHITYTYENAGD
jgi:hypothetical protein